VAGSRDLRGLLGRLLLIVNLAVAVGTSCYVLLCYLAPESMSVPPHAEPGIYRVDVRSGEGVWLTPLLAGALLVADFLWLIYGPAPRTPTAHVISETPGGPVRVSREAIEAGLRSAGEALDEISRLRVSLDAAGPLQKKIVVRTAFTSPDGVSIQIASQKLRDALRRRFGELVRLAEGMRLELEIEFAGFQGRLSKRSEEPESAPEEVDAPFTGPRYPIDDDPVGS
jgi:hypothetical protein